MNELSESAAIVLAHMRDGRPLVGSLSDYGRNFRLELGDTWENVVYEVAKELIDSGAAVSVDHRNGGHIEYRPSEPEDTGTGSFFNKNQQQFKK